MAPGPDAAVVGGNVLTSQRVVDVILKAFGACAASQGCMNNVTFGDESFGYCIRERAPYINKRALNIHRKSAIHLQKSPTYTPKKLYISAKEPCIRTKRALYICKSRGA